jgi:hypothetical protein
VFICSFEVEGDKKFMKEEMNMKLRTVLATALTIGVFLAGSAGQAHADYTWYTYNGMQYAITQNYNSWQGAENEAISQGGHLATLTDANQISWILNTFPNVYIQGTTDWGGAFFWIGLHNPSGNLTSSSDWAWSSGATSTYWQSITLKLWGWNQNYPLGDPATGLGPDSPYAYFHTVPHQGAGTINDQAITGNIVLGLMERSATTPTPIPGAIWLLGSGLLGIAGLRKKIKQ